MNMWKGLTDFPVRLFYSTVVATKKFIFQIVPCLTSKKERIINFNEALKSTGDSFSSSSAITCINTPHKDYTQLGFSARISCFASKANSFNMHTQVSHNKTVLKSDYCKHLQVFTTTLSNHSLADETLQQV